MNKKLIWGVVIAVVVIIVVAGAYFYKVEKETNYGDSENQLQLLKTGSSTGVAQEKKELAKMDITDWKTGVLSELGIEFRYPAYFGNVVVKKTDRTSCPTMKTYARNGILPSQDYILSFSNNPKIGTEGSYMESYVRIARTENNTNYCGLDLLDLKSKFSTDPNYVASAFVPTNASEAYMSKIDTTIGTSADQYYTLYFIERNSLSVIQPQITFIPYANSTEWLDITQREAKGDDAAIVNFIEKSDKAQQIRNYMADFQKVASTFKFTPPASLDESTIPAITSISPKSGPIGTTIEIKGQNLLGFESDANAWLENVNGERGYIGEVVSYNPLRLKIGSKLCMNNTSGIGVCNSYLTITPGKYKLTAEPYGVKSNTVEFTITN